MGLNCGCPGAAALPDFVLSECEESFGQIQKIIFQRRYKTAGTLNEIPAAEATTKAAWTALFSANDGTKAIITPYINAPETEPGAARLYGGGNATVGGIEKVIGRDPTTFTSNLDSRPQSEIKVLKQLMCEDVGVYLIDEYGRIGAIADDDKTPTLYRPIPVRKLFVGDKKLGGFENPDTNSLEWSFMPNWSDNLKIIIPTDFNPLDDLVNGGTVE